MKIYIIFLGMTCLMLAEMSCDSRKADEEKADTQTMTVEDVEEESTLLDPDEIDALPKFASLNEWLTSVYKSQPPTKPISQFHFSLVRREQQGKVSYISCLEGKNNTAVSANQYRTTVDYQPSVPCYILPEKEFSQLSMADAQQLLNTKLIEAAKTESFRNSFLTRSNLVQGEMGDTIWIK